MTFVTTLLSTNNLILIIVGSIVFLVIALVLLYFLFYRNKSLAKQIHEIDGKAEYLHTLLIGQDSQYVKRLEYISQVNLLYTDTFEKFNKRYNTLVDSRDSYALKKMDEIKTKLSQKKFKEIREIFQDVKKFISDFENDVHILDNDLVNVLKPDEEYRQKLYDLKDKYRNVKQFYISHQAELNVVSNSYTQIFKLIDSEFEKIENYIDTANYESSKIVCENVNKIIEEVNKANLELPELCIEITKKIFQKISDLDNDYMHFKNEKFPIEHIIKDETILNFKNELNSMIKSLKMFKYKGLADQAKNLNKELDDLFCKCKEEKDAYREFISHVDKVYRDVTLSEKEFIVLCNNIPKIKKYYIISEEQITKRNAIQKSINKVGLFKRNLESSNRGYPRQPYTVLLSRLKELIKESEQINKEMNAFKKYLSSLKQDTEIAHELINEYYYKLRNTERILHNMNFQSVENKYKNRLDIVYEKLETIHNVSMMLPINVDTIREAVSYLKAEGDSLFNSIVQEENMMNLAESSIVYSNGKRGEIAAINSLLLQSEKMFFDAEFERAFNETSSLLKHYQSIEENKK